MAAPDGGLINETNQQYYAGSQIIIAAGTELSLVYTFDEPLKLYSGTSWSTLGSDHYQNNFIFEYSASGLAPYPEYTIEFKVTNNIITRVDGLAFTAGFYRVRLRETNYGDYTGVSLKDIVNNFIVAYVGEGKIISSVKRTDVLFHAKRCMQEFSYDTLRSVKQQ